MAPCCRSCAAACSARPAARSTAATASPLPSRPSTSSRPMPPAAPVTIATRAVRSSSPPGLTLLLRQGRRTQRCDESFSYRHHRGCLRFALPWRGLLRLDRAPQFDIGNRERPEFGRLNHPLAMSRRTALARLEPPKRGRPDDRRVGERRRPQRTAGWRGFARSASEPGRHGSHTFADGRLGCWGRRTRTLGGLEDIFQFEKARRLPGQRSLFASSENPVLESAGPVGHGEPEIIGGVP